MITTVNVSGDTFIRQNAASTNYNGESYLCLGKTGSASQVDRILLGFDLSSVSGKIISSAILYIYQDYSSYAYSATLPFTAHRITSAFSAATATWNTQPSYDATNGATALSISGNADGQRTFDITTLIKDIIENSRTSYGILLKQTDESTANLRKQFFSTEQAGRQAYVVITYSDPPVTPTIKGYIAASQGSINLPITSVKLASAQGEINKTAVSMKIAASQGSITGTVF